MIKKRGFWKNAFLKRGNLLPMLRYLNRMSARGLHIVRLGRFKNAFDEDKNKRYIYAICNPRTEDYYNEVGRWEKIFEYRSLSFYRKRLPHDSVSIKKRNLQKKAMQEKLWLNERLEEGFLLFGKVEDEYIFERSSGNGKTEYFVDYVSQGKDPDEYLYEKALAGFECISPSTDGITYYFIKREGKDVVTGLKKLKSESAIVRRRMHWAFFALVMITTGFITALVFAVKRKLWVLPCLSVGGSLSLVSLITFLIFRKLYKKENDRILEEEARLEEFRNTDGKENGLQEGQGINVLQNPLTFGVQSQSVQPQFGVQPQSVQPQLGVQPQSVQPQFGASSQSVQPQFGVQPQSVKPQFGVQSQLVQPQFGTQPPYGTQNEGVTYSPVPLIPKITDDSEEWKYLDEDDSEEDEFSFDTVEAKRSSAMNAYEYDGESTRITETEGKKGRFLIYQLISGIFFLLEYVAAAVLGAISCINWFSPEKRGSPAILIIGILIILFLPIVTRFGVGAIRVIIREMKNRNNNGF